MQPIEEYGRGKGRKYGAPAGPYGKIYFGRGYVQLTWLEPGYQERDKASQSPYFRERVERSRSVSAGPADRAGAGGEG